MKIKIEYGIDLNGHVVATTYFGEKIYEGWGSSALDAKKDLVEKVKLLINLPAPEIMEV
ncbi:hypothetical protein LCGC14_2755490 [marine sediment metagenome]|uniref:Mandelate racemase/muconate lactonizing enzyme N-terminal domain-containing protein n=1 Tax=marine sediment metagenome TaxID=412755 RepID=A0A0F8Z0N6_9ZZZZ